MNIDYRNGAAYNIISVRGSRVTATHVLNGVTGTFAASEFTIMGKVPKPVSERGFKRVATSAWYLGKR